MGNNIRKWTKLSVAQSDLMWCSINTRKDDLVNLLGFHGYVTNDIRFDCLEKAWNNVLEYNDALRLRIKGQGIKRQYVEPYYYENIPIKKVDGYDGFCELEKEERSRAVFMCKGPLYRVTFADCGNGEGGIIACIHNIAIDGYSLGLVFKQLEDFYYGHVNGNPIIPKKVYSYFDYINGEKKYLKSNTFKADLKWWKEQYNKLSAKNFCVPVPKGSRSVVTSLKTIKFTEEEYSLLSDFCKENNCSISSVVMTLMAVCVYRITGKKNFSMYNLSHGRWTYSLKQTVGCMVQGNPVFFNLNVNQNFKQLAQKEYLNYLQFLQHGRLPSMQHILIGFFTILKKGYMHLWPWMLYSPMDLAAISGNSKLGLECFDESELENQFYAAVYDMPNQNALQIDLNYQSKVFSNEEIDKIIESYSSVQYECLTKEDIPIIELFE